MNNLDKEAVDALVTIAELEWRRLEAQWARFQKSLNTKWRESYLKLLRHEADVADRAYQLAVKLKEEAEKV